MNNKHRKTYELVFSVPVTSKMRWSDIRSLLEGVGAQFQEGKGSRVRIGFEVYFTGRIQ